MRRNDFRQIAICYGLGKYIHDFILISKSCNWLRDYFIYEAFNMIGINNKIIVRTNGYIFQGAVAIKHDYGIYWNAVIVRKIVSESLNMAIVLHNRIVETVFLPAVG